MDGTYSRGIFETPTVSYSKSPALLGLRSLRQRRCLIDLNTLQLHLCGPGDYNRSQVLPPGTDSYQCLLAPSGHLLLPCGEFQGLDESEQGSLDVGPNLVLPVLGEEGAKESSSSSDVRQ